MIDEKSIQDLRDRITAEYQPERIILFGSYAYGNPGADSDLDILVILEHGESGPKKAAEGDEAIGRVLSKPGTYRLLRSGTVRINGYEGFEIESEFFFIGDRERRRHRVYLSAGDMLYVLCFDAMPARQWGSVKDGFQSILNSVR